MYLEIYVDILFLINFGMDIIILLILRKILKQKSTWIRLTAASSVGSLFACFIAIFHTMPVPLKIILMYIITSILMVRIAFSYKDLKNIVKAVFVLFIITFFLGGMFNSLYYYTNVGYYFNEIIHGRLYSNRNVKFFLLTGFIILLIVRLFLWYFERVKVDMKDIYDIELINNCKTKCLKGFLDTGNSLRDPLTHKPVMIGEYESIKELIPEDINLFLLNYYQNKINQYTHKSKNTNENSCNSKERKIISESDYTCQKQIEDTAKEKNNSFFNVKDEFAIKIKYIPYHSIGKESGNLIGIVFDQVNILTSNNSVHNEKVIVAVFQGKLSTKEDYHIILHKELL